MLRTDFDGVSLEPGSILTESSQMQAKLSGKRDILTRWPNDHLRGLRWCIDHHILLR